MSKNNWEYKDYKDNDDESYNIKHSKRVKQSDKPKIRKMKNKY